MNDRDAQVKPGSPILPGKDPSTDPGSTLSNPLAEALHSASSPTSLVLIGLSLIAYSVAFGREVAIAAAFGASLQLDLFLVAFTLPLFFSNIPLHILDATLVPAYLARREEDSAGADRMASGILNLIFSALLLGLMALFVVSGKLFPVLFPGYEPDRVERCLRLLWWLLPFIVCAGMSNALQPLLNGRQAFHVPPLGQIANGLTVITCIVLFAPQFGIWSLCLGVLAGAFLSLLVHVKAMLALRFQYHWRPSASFPSDLRRMGKPALLLLLAAALSQGLGFISRILGSHLPPGNISALNYAFVLVQVLVVVFAVSQSTLLYPRLAVAVARKDSESLRRLFRQGLLQQLLFLLPLTVGLWLLNETVVRILLERGSFDRTATRLTADALGYYSIGLVPWGLSHFCSRVLYSLQKLGPLVFFHGVNFAGALCLGWWLMQRHGHLGVALGTSLSFVINAAILVALSLRHVNASLAPAPPVQPVQR